MSIQREQDNILDQFVQISEDMIKQVEQYDMDSAPTIEDNAELWAMDQLRKEFQVLGISPYEAEDIASRIPINIKLNHGVNEEQQAKIVTCIENMAHVLFIIRDKIYSSERWENPEAIFNNMVSQMDFNLEL